MTEGLAEVSVYGCFFYLPLVLLELLYSCNNVKLYAVSDLWGIL